MLEEEQYQRLKAESARTGRSIGELVRDAIDARWSRTSTEELRAAFEASAGAWSDLDVDGETYVERIRSGHGLGERLRELGWD